MPKSGFVAIIGRPNAGKSTLLNAILGTSLSIVTPKAQTTREKTLGILTEKEGQIVFIDTPGIHKARQGGINAFMVEEAKQALEGPSVIWYLVDPRSGMDHEQEVLGLLEGNPAPIVILMNKADDRKNAMLADNVTQALQAINAKILGTFEISAKTQRGVNELLDLTWGQLEEGPLYYPDEDQLSDRPTRYFVGEKIREQLYLKLGEELPYSCAVQIEKYDEKAKPPRIEAVIYVERDSQKGMVVGKGGSKIKEIGSAARVEIESFLGEKIFLGLQVKLLKDWTRDAQALKRMGYVLPKPKKGAS